MAVKFVAPKSETKYINQNMQTTKNETNFNMHEKGQHSMLSITDPMKIWIVYHPLS